MAEEQDELLTPSEVARLFSVDPKTVARWAKDGILSCTKTPGGHRRYWKSEIMRLIESGSSKATHTD